MRVIREGRIKFDKFKEELKFYFLWGDDFGLFEKIRGLFFIFFLK